MKIQIPDDIRSNITNLNTVCIEITVPKGKKNQIIECPISKEHIFSSSFVELHNSVFLRATKIRFKTIDVNNQTDASVFDSKESAVHSANNFFDAPTCVRHKTSSNRLYEDTTNGRTRLFKEITTRTERAKSASKTLVGTKNLIYYSVYFDNEYLSLLETSLNSLFVDSEQNFDVVVITDEPTKALIEQFNSRVQFFITDTPKDGVEASINKTRIFEWNHIQDYCNVLYVDADVVFLTNPSSIFEKKIPTNKLCVVKEPTSSPELFRTLHYGFDCLDDRFVEKMKQQKQLPFNAGQFLFTNTAFMKLHFDNLKWMIANWSGEYFFEQGFMNYYFCKGNLVDNELLSNDVLLLSTLTANNNQSEDINSCFVHFIGPPLNGQKKLSFIDEWLSTYVAE